MTATIPADREVRDTIESVEIRSAPEGSKSPGTLIGYAAIFNRASTLLEDGRRRFHETIRPGAFASAIEKSDVRALFNHDPSSVLGRKSAGTLRMVEDGVGLRVEIDLPNTTLGRDVGEMIGRRDIQGQSFSFTVAAGGHVMDINQDPAIRTISEVGELFDVGPVTFPAYEDTSIAMRCFRSVIEAAKLPPPPPPPDPRIAIEGESDTARLRLLEVS